MNSGNDTCKPRFFRDKKSYVLCLALFIAVMCPMVVFGAEAEAPKPVCNVLVTGTAACSYRACTYK